MIVDGLLGQVGDKVRPPALHQVWPEIRMGARDRAVCIARLWHAAAEYRRVVGFSGDDPGRRIGYLQRSRDTEDGTAGAEAGDEVVERVVFEVLQDLLRRRLRVRLSVGLVLELLAKKIAVLHGQLDCLVQHAGAHFGCRCEDDFRAQETQHFAPFDAEVFRHRHDQWITFMRAHHGQADARIAAGRFDHRLAGLQFAGLFRVLDDCPGHAVFYRAHGVEGFDLGVDVDAFRSEPV